MRCVYSETARDSLGNVVGGATVRVYLAGTTTPATFYQYFSSTAATTGVTTGSDGVFTLYVDRFDYDSDQKFKIIISKGTTSLTYDNVSMDRVVTGTYTISDDKTVSTHITVPKGVVYSVASGKTLTFSGSISAGLYQIFSGSGTVAFSAGSIKYLCPEWSGTTETISENDFIVGNASGRFEKKSLDDTLTLLSLGSVTTPIPLSYLDTDDELTADSDSKVPSQKAVKAYADALVLSVGSGDVVGPGSSTDGDLALFSGATGKILKESSKSISTDGTFAGDSDTLVPTQKATKTYADTKIPTSNLLDEDDMASNSATKPASQQSIKAYADTKIPLSYIDTDDELTANSDTKIPSQKAVKAYADGLAITLGTGDVVGPGSSTDGDLALFSGATGKILKESSKSISTDGTFAGNSDVLVPTQKASKTYADTKISSSYLDTDGTLAANSDAKIASQKATKTYADTKIASSYLDTDEALTANSDTKIATQQAVKAYVDGKVTYAMGSTTSKNVGTIYKATTDGIVTVSSEFSDAGSLTGYSDASSPPTTMITSLEEGSTAVVVGMTFPVKKNNYWVIEGVNNTSTLLKWTPMGS
jgi:hypothetical protein